ncbi:hypothetical protein VTN77DRAFT_2436 [Rasamsonia byssochlamydoides]|uniref:uncharacterized protein n=1 Tax=Rasamsonia byssochlamydoides TaxID=89139 RepID=UPI0037438FA7
MDSSRRDTPLAHPPQTLGGRSQIPTHDTSWAVGQQPISAPRVPPLLETLDLPRLDRLPQTVLHPHGPQHACRGSGKSAAASQPRPDIPGIPY